jgi:hypothetical protein
MILETYAIFICFLFILSFKANAYLSKDFKYMLTYIIHNREYLFVLVTKNNKIIYE